MVTIQEILAAKHEHNPTIWHNKVVDSEGHNSHDGTPWTASRGNNISQDLKLAHDRLNEQADFLDANERIIKGLRFDTLLLKAALTSGLTSNIIVEDFATVDNFVLSAGAHDPMNQRIYLP